MLKWYLPALFGTGHQKVWKCGNYYHTQWGSPDKDCAIKELVVYYVLYHRYEVKDQEFLVNCQATCSWCLQRSFIFYNGCFLSIDLAILLVIITGTKLAFCIKNAKICLLVKFNFSCIDKFLEYDNRSYYIKWSV